MNASRLAAACSPVIEQLESRQMLAVTLADGVLKVTGTRNTDTIIVRTASNSRIIVTMAGRNKVFTDASVDLVDIRAGGGDDNIRVKGRISNVTINGGNGDDDIVGGSRNDLILGGAGDDVLEGSNGHDMIYGDGGDDELFGGLGNDTLGGDDEDNLVPILGQVGNDTLNGGEGHDWLLSGQEVDLIEGINDPSGNDVLTGGPGIDVIDIRGRNASNMEVGAGDTITDTTDTSNIIPINDVSGDVVDENDYTAHKHAFLRINILGQQINIPAGAGTFNGHPVFHTHSNEATDFKGSKIHAHNTDAARAFILKEFFSNWGISFSSRNIGRLRVDDDHRLTMTVQPKGGTIANNQQFQDYAIQTDNGATNEAVFDRIVINYEAI